MKRKIIYVLVAGIILILLLQINKMVIKKEYEEMAYESINRAIKISEAYLDSKDKDELQDLSSELLVYSVIVDKLQIYNNDFDFRQEIEKTRSILSSKEIKEYDDVHKGLTSISEDIYSDIGYSYLNSFINKNIGE